MFLFKTKNNNRGYSTINWALLLVLTMFLLCVMLDVVNLFTVKNIMVNRLSYLANVGTIQGGFIGGAPSGWNYLFPGKDYVTNREAEEYIRNSFSSYSFISIADIDIPGQVPVHTEGQISLDLTFYPIYSSGMGISSKNLHHATKFCGFYWYEGTRV